MEKIRIKDLSIPLQICAYTILLQTIIYTILILLYIIIGIATVINS